MDLQYLCLIFLSKCDYDILNLDPKPTQKHFEANLLASLFITGSTLRQWKFCNYIHTHTHTYLIFIHTHTVWTSFSCYIYTILYIYIYKSVRIILKICIKRVRFISWEIRLPPRASTPALLALQISILFFFWSWTLKF